MVTVEETLSIQAIHNYEGFTVEEAALKYKARQKLPASAFCGPNRTYPAHRASNIKSGLQRLSQFGGKLKPSTRISIARCLVRRAKRAGIEVSDETRKKLTRPPKNVGETFEDEILDWYLDNYYKELKKYAVNK